jgi:hypothetical protein
MAEKKTIDLLKLIELVKETALPAVKNVCGDVREYYFGLVCGHYIPNNAAKVFKWNLLHYGCNTPRLLHGHQSVKLLPVVFYISTAAARILSRLVLVIAVFHNGPIQT